MSIAVIYKTKPNYEHKAARELEQHQINAVVPYDDSGKRKRVTAPGYVFAGRELHAAFVKHVGKQVGRVSVEAIAKLYVFKPRVAEQTIPFKEGQPVHIGEVPGTVLEIRGRTCIVETKLLGKIHRQAIHYSQLRPG